MTEQEGSPHLEKVCKAVSTTRAGKGKELIALYIQW